MMKFDLKRADDWIDGHRAWALLGTVILTLLVLGVVSSISGADLFRQFFYPHPCPEKVTTDCDVVAWKDLFQAALLILGLPVGFLLWHWRDRNTRAQIENTRKDINLKEFQEVQLRAAGALNTELQEESREQLQIAALHQLRGFLRGDYGESFRRPAFELILSGHTSSLARIGLLDIRNQPNREVSEDEILGLKKKFSLVDRTRISIIREEHSYIFSRDFPLENRNFDCLELNNVNIPSGINLSGCHFVGTDFSDSTINGVLLSNCELQFAYFRRCRISSTKFWNSRLYKAVLDDANLESSEFINAHLNQASLVQSSLKFTDFREAYLGGATLPPDAPVECMRLDGCYIDKETRFCKSITDGLFRQWYTTSEEERQTWRQPWIDHGATYFDSDDIEILPHDKCSK